MNKQRFDIRVNGKRVQVIVARDDKGAFLYRIVRKGAKRFFSTGD